MKARRALLASVALLVSCGHASVNSADRTFVADMAPHHALGVRMAALALLKADDVRVREFGFTMGRYQQAEFDRIASLATTWKAPEPMMMAMSGMLSPEEEATLGQLDGQAFDRLWLQQMIRHHQGAVSMATTETGDGNNPEAKVLAQSIIDLQTKEIRQMRVTLDDLSK